MKKTDVTIQWKLNRMQTNSNRVKGSGWENLDRTGNRSRRSITYQVEVPRSIPGSVEIFNPDPFNLVSRPLPVLE